MTRPARAVWPLVIWSLLVWLPRINNIWADGGLSTGGQVWRTALALTFVVGAAVLIPALVRARGGALDGRAATWVRWFAVWTAGVWIVRGTQILLADHDIGFVVVHTVLAVVSIAVAAVAAGWGRAGVRPGSMAEAAHR